MPTSDTGSLNIQEIDAVTAYQTGHSTMLTRFLQESGPNFVVEFCKMDGINHWSMISITNVNKYHSMNDDLQKGI